MYKRQSVHNHDLLGVLENNTYRTYDGNNDPVTHPPHLHQTHPSNHLIPRKSHATYGLTRGRFNTIYEPRRRALAVAASPRPAAAEVAANNLLAAPPVRPSSTGSVGATSLGAVGTFRMGPVPDDAAFAGAVFLLLAAAAGPLSLRLIVFSFSGARGSLVSSSSAVGLILT